MGKTEGKVIMAVNKIDNELRQQNASVLASLHIFFSSFSLFPSYFFPSFLLHPVFFIVFYPLGKLCIP